MCLHEKKSGRFGAGNLRDYNTSQLVLLKHSPTTREIFLWYFFFVSVVIWNEVWGLRIMDVICYCLASWNRRVIFFFYFIDPLMGSYKGPKYNHTLSQRVYRRANVERWRSNRQACSVALGAFKVSVPCSRTPWQCPGGEPPYFV